MSINSELQRLDAVRDALVESVNSKGGSLPEDATLWQVKAGVDTIQQGGGGGGVDTSTLSATPEDVLEGKTFYGKDSAEPQTGTIPVYTELPDLTPSVSWSGVTVTISTPVQKLKKGFYNISGLEVLGHSRSEMIMDSVNTETVITPDRGPAVKLTYDGGWHYPMDGLYYLDIDFTQEQEITPGTEDIEIPANRWIRPHGQNFDKGIIIKGDADLVPENIRSGVNIFGVAGAYGGKEIPDRCIVFLGGDGCLYVRKGSGVSVGGLDCNIDAGWGDWTAYGPFDQAGAFSGSVLSQNEVYLSWLGFTDFTKKWTLHTLVSGYPATEAYWPAYHPRFAWGFDTRENGYEDNYSISDLPVYVYGERSVQSGTGVTLWDGAGSNGNIPAAGLHPVGFTWDGPNSRAYWFNTHGGNVVKTTVYPYDEEMGMPGEKYTVGRRLFLGKPSTFTDNWNGNITTNSGMPIGGFALELNPEGYTDGASYISPLLDGTYKNL